MKKLFQNLIWPAVAGNVAWAFFTVAIEEPWSGPGVCPRLALLLLLAVYLASDWLTTEEELDRLKPWYWVADALHASTVAVLAIATQMKEPWLDSSLRTVFLIAAGGHLIGAWEPTGTIHRRWRKRFVLVGMNALGLLTMFLLASILPEGSLWPLPSALAVAVALWFMLRRPFYG